jgi:hypothetical protein
MIYTIETHAEHAKGVTAGMRYGCGSNPHTVGYFHTEAEAEAEIESVRVDFPRASIQVYETGTVLYK